MSDRARDGSVRAVQAGANGTAATPARVAVRIRLLPAGEFRDAVRLGWKGRLLEIELQGVDFPLGAPLEIESGPMLYLGELHARTGPVASILVEHSLDREKLASDREHWG